MSGSIGGFIGSLPQLLGIIEGAAGGTLPVILAQLENAGLSARVQSWLGHGESLPVTAEELETVFTPEQLNAWAEHAGTTPEAVLQAMAVHLPDAAGMDRQAADQDPLRSSQRKDHPMLQVSSAMRGYAIAAKDGTIGTVSDVLFDQTTWTVRWLVVDTGKWLTGRKVLVHPSAIDHVDNGRRQIGVALTRKQVEDSPDIGQDRPVSQQMQNDLYSYYGWDPLWNGGMYGAGLYGGGLYAGGLFAGGTGAAGLAATALPERDRPHGGSGWQDGDADLAVDEGDPNLRSVAEVARYHIHATDGSIGHVEHVLLDTPSWSVRYLVVNTSNWWVGQHVLISPYAIKDIDWSDRSIRLDITRAKVKASPSWNPSDLVDGAFERRLHEYYGWPGHGR